MPKMKPEDVKIGDRLTIVSWKTISNDFRASCRIYEEDFRQFEGPQIISSIAPPDRFNKNWTFFIQSDGGKNVWLWWAFAELR